MVDSARCTLASGDDGDGLILARVLVLMGEPARAAQHGIMQGKSALGKSL